MIGAEDIWSKRKISVRSFDYSTGGGVQNRLIVLRWKFVTLSVKKEGLCFLDLKSGGKVRRNNEARTCMGLH